MCRPLSNLGNNAEYLREGPGRGVGFFLYGERPLLAESSRWELGIYGVASVRYTPKAATQMLVSRLI